MEPTVEQVPEEPLRPTAAPREHAGGARPLHGPGAAAEQPDSPEPLHHGHLGPHGGRHEGAHRHPEVTGSMRPHWYRRLRGRVVVHPGLEVAWRLGILLVGSVLLAAGVAMLVLPGPGWVMILVGLAVLSWEYAWAERTLVWTRERVRRARERAMDPAARRRNQLLGVLALVTFAAAVWGYLAWFGWPGPLFAFLGR